MRTVTATRYVTPFREGGSLPALVEADDDGLYVVKFRGAGQGPRSIAAELVAGELARELGLPVPELVFAELDPRIASAEPDPEIQELLAASAGLNVGLDFLPAAMPYNPLQPPTPELAARIVWFDALVLNVDRTPRNPNLLSWHGGIWMIDHGASFYRHHNADSPGWDARHAATGPFPRIAEHVLLDVAGPIEQADEALGAMVTEAVLARLGSLLPPTWSRPDHYTEFLRARLAERRAFVMEAEGARRARR